ncbi:unnamed protein product [Parajaminaea phylloscopi]
MAETTNVDAASTKAETTKRERSTSPDRVESDRPDAKRAKETEEAAQGQKQSAAMTESETSAAPATEEQNAVELDSGANADDHAEPKPSTSSTTAKGEASSGNAASPAGSPDAAIENAAAAAGAGGDQDLQPQNIAMRALIVTGDASIIIGKRGQHINEIRDKSGARLTISESIPGNPERIMTVAGQLDAVSKAFGLVVRRINDEPFDQASLPGSRAVTIRFIIPNSRMGSVIGKGGTKIKEIQEASGARLNAGEQMLPGSTERVLSISGVADAVHIAVYYVGTILLEHSDRNANNLSYRPGPGGSGAIGAAYSGGRGNAGSPPGPQFGGAFPGAGGGDAAAYGPGPPSLPPGSQTQQIFIPNDLVGCIIGKGGSKINEIRQMSASHIKIMEPQAGIIAGGGPNERLVTITGPPQNIQVAVQLLYQRLEQEKMRMASQGAAGNGGGAGNV